MSDHEGPRTYTVAMKTCGLCKWHKQRMLCSGRNPVYHHFCKHPNVMPNDLPSMIGEPDERFMGESDSTPNWCPVISPSRTQSHKPTQEQP